MRTLSTRLKEAHRPGVTPDCGIGVQKHLPNVQAAGVLNERVGADPISIPSAAATEHPIEPIARASSRLPASGPPPLPRWSERLFPLGSPDVGLWNGPCPDLYQGHSSSRCLISAGACRRAVRGLPRPSGLGVLSAVGRTPIWSKYPWLPASKSKMGSITINVTRCVRQRSQSYVGHRVAVPWPERKLAKPADRLSHARSRNLRALVSPLPPRTGEWSQWI